MADQSQSDLPKLAAPARRALRSAGIIGLKDLTKVSEDELMQLHGMGGNALGALRDALEAKGLSFRESKKVQGKTMDKNILTHLEDIRSQDGGCRTRPIYSSWKKPKNRWVGRMKHGMNWSRD